MLMTPTLRRETRYFHHQIYNPTISAFVFSFFSPLTFSVSHEKSILHCVPCVPSPAFSRIPSVILSFLHPKALSLFPGSFPLGKEQANPYSIISRVWNLPVFPLHCILIIVIVWWSSQASFWKKFPYTLALPHSWTYLFWFIAYGYKNLFLSRPLSTFKLLNLGIHLPSVSIFLELQETFHTVACSQLLQMRSSSASVTVYSAVFHSYFSFSFFSVSLAGSYSPNIGLWPWPFYAVLSLMTSAIPSYMVDSSHIYISSPKLSTISHCLLDILPLMSHSNLKLNPFQTKLFIPIAPRRPHSFLIFSILVTKISVHLGA